MTTFSKRDLFGGALTIDLPSSLIDASDLRQVPDTQEVFLSPDSDISYIVEILEAVPSPSCQGAVRLHFDSLAHDNSASSSTVLFITSPSSSSSTTHAILNASEETPFASLPPSPPHPPARTTLTGTQRVQKFGRGPEDEVRIFLALWRITGKAQDVVFTINCPDATRAEWAQGVFERAAASLVVRDYGLFADP